MNPAILFTVLTFAACTQHGSEVSKPRPATVEKSLVSDGTPVTTLTAEARKRLGIESNIFQKNSTGVRTFPISSLLYDNSGTSWVFVEPVPLKFHRERIQILHTQNQLIEVNADFSDRIPVVVVGAAELNGAESGVGK